MPRVPEEDDNTSRVIPTQVSRDRAMPHRTALTRRTSLLLPPSLPITEWGRIGKQIFAISDSSCWWLGDWLIYGQAQYPDRYKRATEETSLDYQTLRNYAWVARKFGVDRRRSALSFQHHAEVAGLDQEQQDRWLDLAVAGEWSRTRLRREVRAGRTPARDAVAAGAEQALKLRMSVPVERRQRWQDAAAVSGQDLLSWILDMLDEAASERSATPGRAGLPHAW
ncbi:LmbU family transcriptional regulator [Actinosynnema sp. NPDC023587]|uniref:LmbU family transcriptional regulator n=1 Tax=Actinosynnema sp. NPDC023587 TaxID=3154695 RepID=UPI0033F8A8CC